MLRSRKTIAGSFANGLIDRTAWRDWVGVTASIACAIHCAAMPFVIAYLPSLGLSFLADEAFHQWMALACFLLAIAAFIPGLKKHGSWIPLSIAAVGLSLIIFAAMGGAGDCCASCHESVIDNAASESVCDDCDSCQVCHSQPNTPKATVGTFVEVEQAGTLALILLAIAPWITPVGCGQLVTAHLCNRRLGCLCGCCSNEPLPDAASLDTATNSKTTAGVTIPQTE